MRESPDGCYHLVPAAQHAGQRLDVFLARRFGISRSALQQRLQDAVFDRAGRPLKWSQRLAPGRLIRVRRLRRPEPRVPVDYRLLAADAWWVVVDKGPGAPVHPARSFRSRTVLTRLRAELDEPTLAPAHRLDRETSGVLVFGRGPQALRRLARCFSQGRARKDYLAVVSGRPCFDQRCVELPLGRDADFPIRCRMRVDASAGQPACTEVAVLARGAGCSLVRARPRTGRMHQIRVHLATLGHPLLGDKLYRDGGRAYLDLIDDALQPGWAERLGHHRLALHAHRLELAHPGDGAPRVLEAPLPADLVQLLPADLAGLLPAGPGGDQDCSPPLRVSKNGPC